MEDVFSQALQTFLPTMLTTVLPIIGVLIVLKVAVGFVKKKKRGGFTEARRDMRDPTLQMDAIAQVGFEKTRLMNKGEFAVFITLEQTAQQLGRGLRVMAQVNLGEILRPDPAASKTQRDEAFASINSKRVDFLVINRTGEAALAVEVQGSGHHLGKTAFIRDAVKREALRRAGIPLLEVDPASMRPEDIAAQMSRQLSAA